ncbi:hypothetical protein [Longimicrobium terrae]|uniref:Uncharacterized protein n=1 Tax=Longimicrobium terrae TaxID=1639882 RepID=A0A841GXF8_9BACT|nr:hypothetical protein [Longimicrobium terrae]MBB4635870.1 hypothetical protein [Longimicrobium terrae]MBB6070266.1 hypothetical protein [Longimicrobium terrae]NNC30771.1 hypothetical protein [Longimicrobium terrae]
MSEFKRPLAGIRVGLSISGSEESEHLGFPSWQVNRTTLYLVNSLIGMGAGVVFGHDWRSDGVMAAITGFASRVQLQGDGEPLLINMVAWPDRPFLTVEERARLAPSLCVEEAGLPEELRMFEQMRNAEGNLFAYLRARGLTHMRLQLAERSAARLCIGGRVHGSSGRYPGIVEEALIALNQNMPLYLAGIWGGATQQIIDAVQGREMPSTFGGDSGVGALYIRPPNGIEERAELTQGDRVLDPIAAWSAFRHAGVAGLIGNGLTESENEELFNTRVLKRVSDLVLAGLSRLHKPS